jgi:hypothetical protein
MNGCLRLGVIALAVTWGSLAVAADATTPAEPPSSPVGTNPLAAHSLESLSATRDRPLFSPGRRPPPPPPPVIAQPIPPVPPMPPPTVVLFGIVTDRNGAAAVVRGGASDKIIRARLGDEIEGWKVTRIEPRSLMLSHDDRSVTFALFAKSGANGPADQPSVATPSKLVEQNRKAQELIRAAGVRGGHDQAR